MLSRAESNGLIRGLKVSRQSSKVSHLFFADDSLLLFRAVKSECEIIVDILKSY